MVSPIGPVDEPQGAIPADLSALGMAASEASRSQEAQEIASSGRSAQSKPSVDTIQEFRMIAGARRSLASFMDRISQLFSSSKPSAATFDEAKLSMEAAKQQMQSATTIEDLRSGWTAFQDAVKNMEKLADPAQMQEVNVLKAEIADKQGSIDQILELGVALEELNQLHQDLLTTSSMDVVNAIRGKIEASRQKVEQLLKDLNANGIQSPVIDDAAAKIESKHEEILALAEGLQQIYSAGKNSLAALESAQKNNSAANIANSQQIITAAKKTLAALSQLAPNSPIVKKAIKEVNKADQGLDSVEPSGGLVGSIATSVAASQDSGKNISEKRLALLNDNANNETLTLILNGFRSMIQHFHAQSNEAQGEQGDVSREVQSSLDELKIENPSASDELQGLEESLFAPAESAQESFADALSALAAASVKLGGGTSAQATQTGNDVKQLYTSSSSPRKSASLRGGYQSWKRLNTTFAASKNGVQDVLNQAMRPALSTPLPQGTASSRSDNVSNDIAQSAVQHSRNLGDLYQAMLLVEQGVDLVKQNQGQVPHDFRSKLTELVSKAPQFGYPYMQLPPQEAQRFMQQLEEAFIRGSRELAEKKEAEFVQNPQFIQQVLTNVASLFAAYLQN